VVGGVDVLAVPAGGEVLEGRLASGLGDGYKEGGRKRRREEKRKGKKTMMVQRQ